MGQLSVEELETVDKPDDSLDEDFVRKVFYVCLNSGKILLESGAETYRIEDTMIRMAGNYGIGNVQVFVTTTVIILSMNDYALSQTIRIDERANNLQKVVNINDLSRRITKGLPI
ncbi:MAG: threonine/serine exporter family protein, partial [Jeotgalicoccus sp.]|nr:threonine/serine exporter family protein [Jeotgalicoccus sp.]